MKINDLTSLKQFFNEHIQTPIFGVDVYAFDRLGLEGIVPNYRLIALRYSLDTKLIEKEVEVFSLERGASTKHINEPRNSTTVIRHPMTKKYLDALKRPAHQTGVAGGPALLVYKTSSRMEQACRDNGWLLVGAPVAYGKVLLEDKVKFRRILEKIGVPPPPGEVVFVKNVDFARFANTYGLPFVLQHPRRGGGKGTFFINSQEECDKALKKLSVYEKEGAEIREDVSNLEVIVAQYINGPSPSITGCVTRHGILSTSPQYQLIDIPELYNPKKGSGLFCGHDWTSSKFSETIKKQAYEIVEKVGTYFKQIGYKGIFGIDFVLDDAQQKLFVTECNPRLLGSFPLVTMAQVRNNEPPILAFHVLEYLGIDYEIDREQINSLMRQSKIGAQMFLHNLTGSWVRNHGEVQAGVYKLKSKMKRSPSPDESEYELDFVRPGYAIQHLLNEDEFLITDGVLQKKSHFSPNRRLARIVTLNKVLNENKKSLTPWAKQVAQTAHAAFDLRSIRFAKLIKFFNPDFLAKG